MNGTWRVLSRISRHADLNPPIDQTSWTNHTYSMTANDTALPRDWSSPCWFVRLSSSLSTESSHSGSCADVVVCLSTGVVVSDHGPLDLNLWTSFNQCPRNTLLWGEIHLSWFANPFLWGRDCPEYFASSSLWDWWYGSTSSPMRLDVSATIANLPIKLYLAFTSYAFLLTSLNTFGLAYKHFLMCLAWCEYSEHQSLVRVLLR